MTFQYFERARAAQQAINDLGAGPPDPCAELRAAYEHDMALAAADAQAVHQENQRLKAALDVENEIKRQMLERLGIKWVPGEPFYSLIEAEIRRLTDHHEQLLQKIEAWNATIRQGEGVARRMQAVVDAAKNLIDHQDEGYATVVSYTIRLSQALEVYQAASKQLPEQLEP